jgi:uncharacterized protein
MDETARRIVDRFALIPHPEGGHFREVYRSALPCRHPGVPDGVDNARCAGTLIYFLLTGTEFSAFHRVRWSDEIWHLYAGGPLELHQIDADGRYAQTLLTTALDRGEPTHLVPAGTWQAARLAPGTPWAFGGCTVAPGFEFADFEMPPRADLATAFPHHSAVIDELTRS